MSERHPIRGVFEFLGMRLARRAVPGLPRGAVVRLARALGRAAAAAPSHVRRVASANLRLVHGPDLPADRERTILCASFQSFALALLDVLWFSRDSTERLRRHVRHDAAFLDRLRGGGPLVLFTGHLGNWETLGQAVAAEGISLLSVAAPLANPAVDRLLLDMRRASGQVIVPQRGAMLKMMRHLRRGGDVAMLLDQNVKPEEGGAFVPFFGLPVPVSQAAAALALRLRCPILSAYLLPEGDGYRVHVGGAIETEDLPSSREPASVLHVTAQITRLCEEAVRRFAPFWLWSYKRWKHVPAGAPAGRYPFYSKPYPPPTASGSAAGR